MFECIRKLKYKYPFLTNNIFFEQIRPYYIIKKYKLTLSNSTCFYTQNTERLNAVMNMLVDDQSKKEYLGMIKFRQTLNKKDWPICHLEPQYFMEKIKLGRDEVFIDCGAYTGDTINEFLKHCSEYKQIVAFEPDFENFEGLRKNHSNNPKVILMNTAVYNRNGTVNFDGGKKGDSMIVDNFDNNQENFANIQVTAIDSLKLEKVTFIKMDVEGAELNALNGAEKTIIRDKPKLAICIYHSNEDMICIAEYIHSLVPEYELYVRHHNVYPYITETVLYAIMP